ncbi:UNVERIFIED_CONTAM: hypothetical protein GTU68_026655 [Idotea baltica]|nr:hypothetical protein [Idotea baltica]
MAASSPIPVIAIDGPSGAGKGAVAQRLAEQLGFHILDSGAVYRAAAIISLKASADISSETAVLAALDQYQASFHPNGTEGVKQTAENASQIAVMPAVRQALLDEQRSFRQLPGLVADGRDMGTVVFPDAQLKVFLTASVEERAQRRSKQLKEKGIETTMTTLIAEIDARDKRDSTRDHAPLKAADGALYIDSSSIDIDGVVRLVVDEFHRTTS